MPFGLGNDYDIMPAFVPTDVVAGTATGNRVHLCNYAYCEVVLLGGTGSTDIPDPALQQHTASSGGSSAALSAINNYYLKDATSLDGSTQWAKTVLSAASSITDAGSASKAQLLVIPVDAASLSDGYEWMSVNIADIGSNGSKYVAGLYILRGLRYGRSPELLPAPLT